MEKKIEASFREYTDLIRITDTDIFDKTIPFDVEDTVFMARHTESNKSVVLIVRREWKGLWKEDCLYSLSSYLVNEEEDKYEYEWHFEGILPDN